MTTNIDIFHPRSLSQAAAWKEKPKRFLEELLVTDVKTKPTTRIDTPVKVSLRRLAPFVKAGEASHIVGREADKILSVDAPRIALKYPITPEMYQDYLPVTSGTVWIDDSGQQVRDGLAELAAEGIEEMQNQGANVRVNMLAQILQTGEVSHSCAGGYEWEIDYGVPNANKPSVLASGDRWDAETGSVLKWLRAAKLAITKGAVNGITGWKCILGTDAAQAFLGNSEVQNLLDIRRAELGRIAPEAIGNYQGTFDGVDFYMYHNEVYKPGASTATDEWATKRATLVPIAGGLIRLRYAIVSRIGEDMDPIRFVTAEYFDSDLKKDPSCLELLYESRPVYVLTNPKGIYTQLVLA